MPFFTTTTTVNISAFDPSFDGGTNCGPNKKDVCRLYIGVYAYCVIPLNAHMSFKLQATLTPTVDQVLAVPQVNQRFSSAYSVNNYQFCVNKNTASVRALLNSWTSGCDCPTSYADLEMVGFMYFSIPLTISQFIS